MEARILTHVEEVEYAKELARQTAARLLAEADVRDLVNDPQGFVDRVLAALLAALGPLARDLAVEASDYAEAVGLQALDYAEIDAVVQDAELKFLAFAAPAMGDAVDVIVARVHDMIGAGVGFATIQIALASDTIQSALVAPLVGATKRLAASWLQFIDRDVNDMAMRNLLELSSGTTAAALLTWVAVMDRNTCGELEDPVEHFCRPRHGQARSLAEWSELGLPGSPVLECSMHSHRGASTCRCHLSAHAKAGAIQHPIAAADAVRRGRDRARAEMAIAA